jgi:aminobenzoyl-glutamate utilization protein B
MGITRWIDENKAQFTKISVKLWAYAETAYKEYKSAKLLTDALEKTGFVVERSVAEIPTAFVGSFGKGKPIIAILGEYDALPG